MFMHYFAPLSLSLSPHCQKFRSLHLKELCVLIMSQYSKNEPTTHEEGVKFGLIIGSIISNCEALFSEKFEGKYELRDFLSTIGLGEFSPGSKRLDGSLWLKYDGYKCGRDVTNITLLCSELWLYTSPNTREEWGDVFTQITKLKNKYNSNSSLCRKLDMIQMSLMCFVEANQLYCMTRELKRTKTDLDGTKDELKMLNLCFVYIRLMREGLSYENAVYVSEVLGIKKEDDLIYVGVKDIDSLDMPSTEKSKFRTICLNYKSDGECTFIKYLRKNGFCQRMAMSISENLGIQLVERISDVTQNDIAKLNLSDDDRTLLLMIWRNYMNELRSEVDSGDLEKIETPRGVYFLLQQLKSECNFTTGETRIIHPILLPS